MRRKRCGNGAMIVTKQFWKANAKCGKESRWNTMSEKSDTFYFIYETNVPIEKKIIYIRCCCDIRLHKCKINRTWLTVVGDQLNYDGKTSTETTKLEIWNPPQQHTLNRRSKMCSHGHQKLLHKLETGIIRVYEVHISMIPKEIIDEYYVIFLNISIV